MNENRADDALDPSADEIAGSAELAPAARPMNRHLWRLSMECKGAIGD